MNKVYIILVNYKGHDDTIECLESLLKSDYTNFQVFVVDNSPDDTSVNKLLSWMNNGPESIETLYPQLVYPLVDKPLPYAFITESNLLEKKPVLTEKVVLVKSTNRGFAAANNVVLKHIINNGADDSLVWILNNDTVVERNCLAELVDFSNAQGSETLIGSKLFFYHQKGILQAVAGRYNRILGSTYHIGEGEIDTGQYDDFSFSDDNYVIGASMFLSKKFLTRAGLMNEDYFLYYEELDWGLRGRKNGFKTALQPAAKVYHKEGASIRGERGRSDFSDYYSIVNRLKFTRKWYPGCIFTVLPGVIYALLKRLLKGKFRFVARVTPQVIKVLYKG